MLRWCSAADWTRQWIETAHTHESVNGLKRDADRRTVLTTVALAPRVNTDQRTSTQRTPSTSSGGGGAGAPSKLLLSNERSRPSLSLRLAFSFYNLSRWLSRVGTVVSRAASRETPYVALRNVKLDKNGANFETTNFSFGKVRNLHRACWRYITRLRRETQVSAVRLAQYALPADNVKMWKLSNSANTTQQPQ